MGRNRIISKKNLPQCHFLHHKPNVTWPGIEKEGERGGGEERGAEEKRKRTNILYAFIMHAVRSTKPI
jgi:hypothetical protein